MKKVRHHRLDADHRPLFPVMHRVHKTVKDKEQERSYQKLKTKKEKRDYESGIE